MVQVKKFVLDLLARLPDDCSLDDVLYHLYVANTVQRGLEDVGHGRVVPHEEVEQALRRKWVCGADQ
jgi:hypothetical protein